MYKPSEPLSDAEDECNLNSPIFGRKNMEEYFYDSSGVKKKDDEENEYSGIFSVIRCLYNKEILLCKIRFEIENMFIISADRSFWGLDGASG